MAFLAMLPQLHLWAVRGSDWQGTYVSFDFDEVAYASYLNALISGRPRLNDPYTGRDNAPNNPQPESSFSTQFLPAYALALPARVLGLRAATMFIIVRALTAVAATIALFWLLLLITRDSRIAAAGAIVILCLGGIAGEPHDAWRIVSLRGLGEPLPFLRRFVPALVFPLLFVFADLVWQALNAAVRKTLIIRASLAGVTLAILIFSYFFLWTTVIAWSFLIVSLWFACRRAERKKAMMVFGIVAAWAAAALVPYAILLSRRASTMDSAQLLTHSRALVFSLPVIIGLIALIAIVLALWRGRLKCSEPANVFAISFALLPAVTFNQQVVTGLLLQPVHYGRYGPNYVSLLAVVLAVVLIWRGQRSTRVAPARILGFIVVVVFGWSVVENSVRTYRMASHNIALDDARRVASRLRELAPQERQHFVSGQSTPVVFCTNLVLGDALPNEAPQAILWTPHLFVFSGSTAIENRERLYNHLYYSGVDEQQFATFAGQFSFVQLALFGWERMNQKPHALPLTHRDVQQETQAYARYIANFGASQAASPQLSYAVVPAAGGASLTNLDVWYRRDAGEPIGDYILYRLTLK